MSLYLRATKMMPCGSFYEPACQVTQIFERATFRLWHTSSDRARPVNQPEGVRVNRVRRRPVVKRSVASRTMASEVTHPFIRALVWHSACRRTVRSDGGAALSVGRLSIAAKRPRALAPPA